MMRKTITRTIATSTIKAFKLSMVNGQPVVENLDPVIIAGKAKEKEALKALKEKYGDLKGVTIGEIETSEATYEISVEDFIKNAKKIDSESEPDKTEEVETASTNKSKKRGN